MRQNLTASIAALALLAAIAIPVKVAGQQRQSTPQPRYKLVDLGTLGGSQSFSFFGDAKPMNNRGTAVGQADTSVPDPNYPNFNPYLGSGAPDPFIEHAFKWQNGALSDLGALPGVNSSTVGWINSRGTAAGQSTNSTIDPITGWPAELAVLWKDGQVINLGTLGGSESQADAINDSGQIAGIAANAVPDSFPSPLGLPGFGTQQRAFLWENGVMRDLGTLGGPDADALLLNDRGQVAGISYTSSTPNSSGVPTIDPFVWRSDKMLDLGGFGGTVGVPAWLNNRGQVVGFSNLAGDTTTHPFLWSEAEGLKDLGALGGTFGLGFWVNESGEAVGAATNQNDQAVLAFLWKDGVMTNLGMLAGDTCSSSEGINSKDQIVGSSSAQCTFDHTDTRAFLRMNGGSMIDLNVFVPPGSGLTLFEAGYINDQGEILALALLPNGDERTVLLVPCGRDHTGTQGCEENAGATFASSQPAPAARTKANVNRGSLTPEALAALRARLTSRYHGFGAWPLK
jgi:probable HAF family extracellular repeat protein